MRNETREIKIIAEVLNLGYSVPWDKAVRISNDIIGNLEKAGFKLINNNEKF